MKIVKDQNNVALFAGADLKITKDGLIGPDYVAPFVTADRYSIEAVDSIPADYMGGHYTYDGKWTKTELGFKAEQNKLAEIEAAALKAAAEQAKAQEIEKAKTDILTAKAEAEGKALSMAYLDKRLTALEKIMGV